MILTPVSELKLPSERYQNGSLKTESRSNGPDVWIYRWRESANGTTVRRKVILGTVKELTKTLALMLGVPHHDVFYLECADKDAEGASATLVSHQSPRFRRAVLRRPPSRISRISAS